MKDTEVALAALSVSILCTMAQRKKKTLTFKQLQDLFTDLSFPGRDGFGRKIIYHNIVWEIKN